MKRRDLIAMFGGAVAFRPLVGTAQESKLALIGYVNWFGPAFGQMNLDALREGLHDLDYAEGRNIAIESYFTDGDRERTREVFRKLVGKPVDILVACATPAAQLAKEATQTIPIVMAPVADPLATGLVQSLAHPGGNLTGLTGRNPDLEGKVLQFLREIDPGIRAISFLGSTKDPNTKTFVRETQAAADRIGLDLMVRLVDGPEVIDEAIFAAMKRNGVKAVVVQPIFTGHQKTIVPLAMKQKLAVVANYPAFAEAGGLLSYGFDNDFTELRQDVRSTSPTHSQNGRDHDRSSCLQRERLAHNAEGASASARLVQRQSSSHRATRFEERLPGELPQYRREQGPYFFADAGNCGHQRE